VNDDEKQWIEHDDALRSRARELAHVTGRDADDLYRTLKQLERTPSARLELGLRHARLRIHGR
jgi:predicted transcriptional regulator